MNIEQAYAWISGLVRLDVGRFYGPANGLALGTGLIYQGVRFPIYDPATDLFVTRQGLVYVVTHECDVEQGNVRPFNDDVLICPVIEFGSMVTRLSETNDDDEIKRFLANLAARKLYRLMYWPPLPTAGIPYGGVMFLNRITYTNVKAFNAQGVTAVGALSAYGLSELDLTMQNHLFRPKDDELPYTRS